MTTPPESVSPPVAASVAVFANALPPRSRTVAVTEMLPPITSMVSRGERATEAGAPGVTVYEACELGPIVGALTRSVAAPEWVPNFTRKAARPLASVVATAVG